MSNTKDGGPAFPVLEQGGDGRLELGNPGMSLRDYFAAKAMQGICANSRWNCTTQQANVVRESYELADAMLKAREQS